jgi:hypothetical protein
VSNVASTAIRLEKLQVSKGKSDEPKFRQLEPTRRLAAANRRIATGGVSADDALQPIPHLV